MSSMENEIQDELLRLYESKSPARQNVQILDLARISDGWENTGLRSPVLLVQTSLTG